LETRIEGTNFNFYLFLERLDLAKHIVNKSLKMKNALKYINIITLILLILIAIEYNIPQKVYKKVFSEKQTSLDCNYSLDEFDFHFRAESDSPKIIMLGNSLIRGGDWDSLLNRKDILNRGISGDRMGCICERLTYLSNKKAKIWFIEGGINDLPAIKIDSIFNQYKTIVDFVKNENAIPVISLIVYISPKAGEFYPARTFYKQINQSIKRLNQMLVQYASENKIDYIDLNSAVSKNDVLQDEYTTDGVHLKPEGYQKWKALINALLIKNGI